MRKDVATSALNVLLGLWFVVSGFMWSHSPGGVVNAVAVGALCVAVGLVAARAPAAFWLDLLLAVWLVASVWIIPQREHFNRWNSVMVAIGLALVPLTALLFPDPSARRAEA